MKAKPPHEVMARKQGLFGIPLFAGINDEAFDFLASMAEESLVHAGHVVVRQGDLGAKLFVITKGEVRILRQGRHGNVEVARMKDGDCFGEMCILERLPRAATVEVVQETQLLMLSYAAFDILFDKMPREHHRILGNIARTLSSRLRELGDFLALRG